MKKKPRLSHREIRMLARLADGENCKEICAFFGISPFNVYTTCSLIRKKTGIKHTRDKDECTAHMVRLSKDDPQRVADALDGRNCTTKDLTFCQMDALRMLVDGRSYVSMAQSLGIRPQSVQNLLSRACQRAGIEHSGWDRTKRAREWWKKHHGQAPADPMDDPMF